MLPKEIQKFIDSFSKLPSFGPRLTTRLAFYIIGKDKALLKHLESAIQELEKLEQCERCFFVKNKDEKLCYICKDEKRDKETIAIIEKETDLLSIEKTHSFKGRYFILGKLSEKGTFLPAQKLRIENLKESIKKECGGKAKEIIIALPLTSFGDFTAMLITEALKDYTKKFSRLGRGIPTGGEIEFADEETLQNAMERRN